MKPLTDEELADIRTAIDTIYELHDRHEMCFNAVAMAKVMATTTSLRAERDQARATIEAMLCEVPGDFCEGDGDGPVDAVQRLAEAFEARNDELSEANKQIATMHDRGALTARMTKAARDGAFERAAQECEAVHQDARSRDSFGLAGDCARRIRALKGPMNP